MHRGKDEAKRNLFNKEDSEETPKRIPAQAGTFADFNNFSAFSGFILSCLLFAFSKLFLSFFVFSWSFGFGFARFG